jgi:hypothetical protein
LWNGFFACFSSVIPSWSVFPLVEDISRIVEGKREEGRGKAGKGKEKKTKKERGSFLSLLS